MNWPFPRVLFYQLLSTIIVWYSMIYHSHSSCPLCLPRHCIWVVANSELCSVCAYVLSIAVDGCGMGYYKPELTCDRKTIRWLFLSMDFHFEIVKLWDCYHRNHRIFIFLWGNSVHGSICLAGLLLVFIRESTGILCWDASMKSEKESSDVESSCPSCTFHILCDIKKRSSLSSA